uniref:Gamma-tubulin complex component n=1 Tax=Cacopsylla melanoneura TaxID=428564 RepID=A0A8D9DXR8_9HEMI
MSVIQKEKKFKPYVKYLIGHLLDLEYDVGWSILSLLSLLAENPTGCLSDSFVQEEAHLPDTSFSISTLQSQDNSVDWKTILREGYERFELPCDESEDEWTEEEDQTVSRLSDSESFDLVTVVSKYQDDALLSASNAQQVTISQMLSLVDNSETPMSVRFDGSDKQFFSKLMRRKAQSVEWLKSHRQHAWWNNGNLREMPLSTMEDANLAIIWEKFTRFEEKLNIVSDHKLLREFLWFSLVSSPNAVICRPYYSISSVRPDTLNKFLSTGLDTLRLYREMISFRSQLCNVLCAHTLRVYACALAKILPPLAESFVHTERLLRSDHKVTLLELWMDNEAEFMNVRYIYYNVHARVTTAWNQTPHYMQAHNLIQVLLHEIQEASNSSRISMITSLLVRCLSVYFESVDVLLSEGRLYDPCNEFFLISTMDNEIVHRPQLSSSVESNEFLTSFYEETASCANDFILVDKLNKLIELESCIENKGTMYAEFVQILNKKFRASDSQDQDNEQNTRFQLDTHYAVDTTLRSTILHLVRTRKHIVSCFIKRQLLQSYNLFLHFTVLCRVLLIDTEYPYLTVYKYILHSMESELGWRNEFHLTHLLEECLDSEFPHFSSHFSISLEDREVTSPHTLEFIDLITINFKIELPVDLVLTSDCMIKYNMIFRFILKIKWALSLVQNLHFKDISTRSTPVKQKLYLLHHSLLHVLCTLQSHHMCLLLQIFSVDLHKEMLSVSSVESLIQAHERHLTTALFHCLLLPKQSPLQQGLIKILCLSEILKLLWSSESQCTLNSLNQLELKYMKAVWNFTELLQRSIPSSSHQVYNSIFDLWSSMLISSPAHNVPED